MKKNVISSLLALCLTVSCSCQTIGPKEDKLVVDELARAYRSNVLIIISDLSGKDIGSGSGVVLRGEEGKPAIILTAGHVATESTPEEKFTLWAILCQITDVYKCTRKQVQIVKKDKDRDLAVVTTMKPMKFSVPAARFATYSPKVGMPVFVIGNPASSPFIMSHGIISRRVGSGVKTVLFTDAAATHGSSGGGMYNYDGELVGVIQGGAMIAHIIPIPGTAQGIGIEGIKAFLVGK